MTYRRLLCVAVGLLVTAAGCGSAKRAQGSQDGGRGSQQGRHCQGPPTPAEKIAKIDKLLASCPDFDKRIGLAYLSPPDSHLSALFPHLYCF